VEAQGDETVKKESNLGWGGFSGKEEWGVRGLQFKKGRAVGGKEGSKIWSLI